MQTRIKRSGPGTGTAKDARTEEIALALMGAVPVDLTLFAEAAGWQNGPNGAAMGRARIVEKIAAARDPDEISVEQVVSHGKAGSVAGRVVRGGEPYLFCHVIRYDTAAAGKVVQVVSFERAEPGA